jgi:sugar lactone lactonase YvrE
MLGPSDCATDISGNLYITDKANNVIRKVNVATGIITTVAGNGYGAGSYTPTGGFSGDGGPALQAQMYEPFGVAVDIAGNIYISDSFNFRIRKVSVATGVITTIAGIGVGGYSGDGGLAVNAKIYYPEGLTVDSAGNVYFVDEAENDVRKITAATGIITTIAGMAGIPGTLSFEGGFSGDGGPATSAMLNGPIGIALDSAGNVYISDSGNDRIRKVNVSTGIIQTVVGNGLYGYAGDGGPATNAELIAPYGITIDSSDNMYIADYMNGVVRKVTPLP